MELNHLFSCMKLDHLATQVDGVCEQAVKRELAYKAFLTEALATEWRGRHLKGTETRLRAARFPRVKTIEQFDFS